LNSATKTISSIIFRRRLPNTVRLTVAWLGGRGVAKSFQLKSVLRNVGVREPELLRSNVHRCDHSRLLLLLPQLTIRNSFAVYHVTSTVSVFTKIRVRVFTSWWCAPRRELSVSRPRHVLRQTHSSLMLRSVSRVRLLLRTRSDFIQTSWKNWKCFRGNWKTSRLLNET